MPSNLTSISFPASPSVGSTYTYGNQTYQWNGTEWVVSYDSNSIPIGAVTLSGNQTITGVKTFSNNIVANGGITGNVTGDLTGTIQTAAQPNITSTGGLTVPSITSNGNAVINGNITGSVIGSLASSLLPTDTILQVKFSTSTTESFHETTDAALPFSDTNVSCAITPKRSNSRIIILCSLSTFLNGTEPRNEIRIMQQIGANPATELANSRHGYVGYTANSEAWLGNNFICCSDTPNTTNTCTYTIQARPGRVTTGTNTVTTFRVNHNVPGFTNCRSSMILVEIAG